MHEYEREANGAWDFEQLFNATSADATLSRYVGSYIYTNNLTVNQTKKFIKGFQL